MFLYQFLQYYVVYPVCSLKINTVLRYLEKGFLMLYELLKFHEDPLLCCEVTGHYMGLP